MQTANATLRDQAIRETHEWIDKANQIFGLNIPYMHIDFKLRGTTAGKAWGYSKIQYQPVLLAENTDHFLSQTVPHEVAHAVVRYAYRTTFKKIRPHGHEWKRVMRAFGLTPDRCHTYDTSNVGQKKGKLSRSFEYKCACKTWNLTIIRHRRYLDGRKYTCPRCRTVLSPV